MSRVPIAKWLEKESQDSLAEKVGVTQTAISKMVKSGRDIHVVTARGKCQLVEHKVIIGKKLTGNTTPKSA